MAWEARRNGRKFYYRSHRRGDRVIKEYFGGGAKGEDAARADAERRAARSAERQAEQQLREAYSTAAEQVAALGSQMDVLMETELVAAGYHRHDRGPWRKKRGKT